MPENNVKSFDLSALETELITLQQQCRAAGVPVVLLAEGWDAAGKGEALARLLCGLDPRGYSVHNVTEPDERDLRYPVMRRYAVDLPAKGEISILYRSWYREVTDEAAHGKLKRRQIEARYQEIVSFETQLVADGAVVLKVFLDISRREQKRRQKELLDDKATRWRVSREDEWQNEHYDEFRALFDDMLARTNLRGAPWHVIKADEKQACAAELFELMLEALKRALADREHGARPWDTPSLPGVPEAACLPIPRLAQINPAHALEGAYKPQLDAAQKRLRALQNELYRKRIPMIIAFEGWDAAGKGGAIRRLTRGLDIRGCRVVPIASPTAAEKAHHHLWRFWTRIPKSGHVTVFDRTWYGRVMVERIEGFCTEAQWRRAYLEINDFERTLARFGTVIVKFWLHIDQDEQLRRFEARQNTPEKQWKITDEDWRNREKWPEYERAVDDMLQKTNTEYAPWIVVESNDKQFARLKVLTAVIEAAEKALER